MRRVLIVNSAEEMRKLRPAWEHLYGTGHCAIFQSYEWNELAARYFCQREKPFVVLAENDSSLAIIPAAINLEKKRLTLLGETLFDYRDVLYLGDESALDSAWAVALSVAAEQELEFAMHSLRRESTMLAAEPVGWSGFDITPFTHAPCMHHQDIRDSHSRLSRNMRRLIGIGCEPKRYSGDASGLLRQIYELKSQQGDSLFRDPLRVEMLIAMAQVNPNSCEIFTLELGSRLVAALVTFIDGCWRRFYTTYHDDEGQLKKHSPGLALIHSVMEESLASGLDCDLMTGDQPYKHRLATSKVPLYRVSASVETITRLAEGAPAGAA